MHDRIDDSRLVILSSSEKDEDDDENDEFKDNEKSLVLLKENRWEVMIEIDLRVLKALQQRNRRMRGLRWSMDKRHIITAFRDIMLD